MSAAVGVRPVAPSSVSSDSEGSSGEEDTGRFKSAVVQAGPKETQSPSSSLSRTPSPLPHASFSTRPPPPFPRVHSPSPPPQLRVRRPREWSHSPNPSQRFGRRRSRSYTPREQREGPRRDRMDRRDQSRTPSPKRKEKTELEEGEVREPEEPQPKKKKEELDPLLTRTGGAYIPPAKLRMLQSQVQDKSSVAYQRLAWEALKKSINGLINKVNVSNIGNIVQELFQENIVRGRGLLVRSVIQAQAASPTFTHVYAALVAIINTKFPQTGELLAKRLIVQFKKGFRRNDKSVCVTASKFLAHLVNQLVLHEIVALEVLTLLLEDPTDDSVEVAVGFLKEIGMKLTEISPRGMHAVFETLRSVLHSGRVNARVQYMIEVMFAIRKDKFQDHPALTEGLDLVQEEDQITHLLSLGDSHDGEDLLNVFQEDDDYLANEDKYKEIKAEILGEASSGSEESSGEESDEEDSEDEEEEEGGGARIDITDKTDAKALTLRRTIYLTIMSSLDYEECAHKLMKNKEDGQEPEIAMMLVECCSQERSYLRFYGLLGQRFCLLNRVWVEAFDTLFQEQYTTVHRLETNKLRNVAKFFAQLFYSDSLPWTGMSCIHLNEEETNSSSRIFVKILFQELAEFMGMSKLNDRLRDPILSESFEGLLPRDNPKNTRFAINFFTSIGLGGLTDDLRDHLKDVQKQIMAQKQEVSSSDTSNSDSDSSSDSSEDSSDSNEEEESSESESSSEDSEEEKRAAKKRRGERETEKGGGRGRGEGRGKRGEREPRDERRERGKGNERENSRGSDKERERSERERDRERSRVGENEQSHKERKHDKKHSSRQKKEDHERDKHVRRRDEKNEKEDSSDSEKEDERDRRDKKHSSREKKEDHEHEKHVRRRDEKKRNDGSDSEKEDERDRRDKKRSSREKKEDHEHEKHVRSRDEKKRNDGSDSEEEDERDRRDKKHSSHEKKENHEHEKHVRRRDKKKRNNSSDSEEGDGRRRRDNEGGRERKRVEDRERDRGRREGGESRKRDRGHESRREKGRGDHDRDSNSPRDKRRKR